MRGHSRGLLVTDINGAEADLYTPHRDVHHWSAGEIEDRIDSFVFERFDDQIVPVSLGHACALLCN